MIITSSSITEPFEEGFIAVYDNIRHSEDTVFTHIRDAILCVLLFRCII